MKPPRSTENELILGLVSVSDRASRGIYDDEGIPSLEAWCRKAMINPLKIHKRLIPDEQFTIEKTLRELVDIIGCDLILTTGGTGPARRDVTPEATLAVATREMPGFGEQMRAISGHFVPTAILSRQVAVLRETPDHAALIINLPGRPKAIAETLEGLKDESGKSLVNGIFAAVPYCIDLIGGPYIETRDEVCKAFRPKNAIRPNKTEENKATSTVEAKTATGTSAEATTARSAAAPHDTISRASSSDAPSATHVAAKPAGTPNTTSGLHPASAEARAAATAAHADRKDTKPAVEPFAASDILIVRARRATTPIPEKTVVWLHGMGVDNSDFASFADEVREFGGPDIRLVLPNAPLRTLSKFPAYPPVRAWFDLRGDQIDDREDELGLRTSAARVMALIESLERQGVERRSIFLGGFSQGAAVSLYAAARLDRPLAGVIALSGYVPLAHKLQAELTEAARETPIFMAHGAFDSVINPLIARRGAQVMKEMLPHFSFNVYDMDHALDGEEMHDVAMFLKGRYN